MLAKDVLDLPRGDRDPLHRQRVPFPVDDVDVPLLVDGGHVPRPEPAVPQDLRGEDRGVPVPVEYVRPAGHDLAHLVRSDFPAVLVDHPDLDADRLFSDGHELPHVGGALVQRVILLVQDRQDAGGLHLAVGLDEAAPEEPYGALEQVRRDHRAAVQDGPQGRKVELPRGGEREDLRHHRGGEKDPGDGPALDRAQRLRRVELGLQDDRRPHVEESQEPSRPPEEGEVGARKEDVVPREGKFEGRGGGGGDQVPVGEHRSSRTARDPAVVDHQRDVRFEDGRGRVRRVVSPPRRQTRIVDPHEAADPRQGRTDLPDPVEELLREQERLHIRVLEDGDQFPADQQVVQRNEGGARPGHREKGLQVEDGVVREDRDAVPLPDPPRAEHGGVASDPVAQLPVGHFLLRRDEGDPGGMGACVVLEDVLDEQGIPPVSAES